jgi:hypothetical protein
MIIASTLVSIGLSFAAVDVRSTMRAIACKPRNPTDQDTISYIQSGMSNKSDHAVDVDCPIPSSYLEDSTLHAFYFTARDVSSTLNVACSVQFMADALSTDSRADVRVDYSSKISTSGSSADAQTVGSIVDGIYGGGHVFRRASIRCTLPPVDDVGGMSSILNYGWTRIQGTSSAERIHKYTAVPCMSRFGGDMAGFDWSPREFPIFGQTTTDNNYTFDGGWSNQSITPLWASCPAVRDFTTSDVDAIKINVRDASTASATTCRAAFTNAPTSSVPGSMYFTSSVSTSISGVGGFNLSIPGTQIPPQNTNDAISIECLLHGKSSVGVDFPSTPGFNYYTSAISMYEVDE